jgi:hypothetical protein
MKIIIAIILSFCSFLTEGVAQSFPNIDFSQPRTCSFGIDNFANQQGDGCNTFPWFASHGTPDALSFNFGRLGAGINTASTSARVKKSEGVTYRQTFSKGKLYVMNITFRSNTDKFNLFLANGVPIRGVNTPTNPNIVNFNLPTVTDKQNIFSEPNTNFVNTTKFISFIPQKDYECLWFFAEDSKDLFVEGELNVVEFRVLSLTCNLDPTKEITSTFSKFNYGSSVLPYHISIAPEVTAFGKINIFPRSRVEILSSIKQFTPDPRVSMVAGKSILIKPDNSLPTSTFHSQQGSVFSAKISSSLGCQEACEGFTDWHLKSFNIRFFNIVDQCRTNPPYNEWRPQSYYPKPYNAYRAEMRVYKVDSEPFLPIFTQVWEDPLKRALPEGCVVWHPAPWLESGVYTIYLMLTNCNGNYVVTDDPFDRWPNVTIGCFGNVKPSDLQYSLQNSLNSQLDSNSILNLQKLHTSNNSVELNVSTLHTSILVSPNPTNGVIDIRSNTQIDKPLIKITNVLGVDVARFYLDELLKDSPHEYNISNLPSGIYIVSVLSDNKIIGHAKINKL